MTNIALDRKIGINSKVNFVKMDLSLRESITPNSKTDQSVKIVSGFFAGIYNKTVEINDIMRVEEFFVLTKDFKSFSLHNVDFFYIMSIMVRHADCRDLTVYKTTIDEQKFANSYLTSIMELLHLRSRTTLDNWLVDVTSYDVQDPDLFFVDEEALLLNINLPYQDAIKNCSTMFPSEVASAPHNVNGYKPINNNFSAPTTNNSIYKTNYSVKEPMFFKRTKTKPSKKLVDKIKAAVMLMGNNPTTEPEEKNEFINPTKVPSYNFDEDYEIEGMGGAMFPPM